METDAESRPRSSPRLPWTARVSLWILAVVEGFAFRRDGTVNRFLLGLLDFKSSPSNRPIGGVRSSDVVVDPSPQLWIRLFVPSARSQSSLPTVVYFHGGGFIQFGADTQAYHNLCRRLAMEVPAVVVSVNYRLAPENRYPAQYIDGFDVLRFLNEQKNGEALPEIADLSRCFVSGDSAGGNLAHHVALRACREQFRTIKVNGVIGLQPFFGGEETTDAEMKWEGVQTMRNYWRAFLPEAGEGFDRDHEAVNVSGPRAVDISEIDLPAAMVVVGGRDVLQDWQRRYVEWLRNSGKVVEVVEFPDMVHGFYVFPEVPETSLVFSQIGDFIHRHC